MVLIWSFRRRGGSVIWRIFVSSMRAAVSRSGGGQTAAINAAAMTTVVRQSEACRGCSGGNGAESGDGVVEQQGEQQVGIEPGPGEVGVLGGQPYAAPDRLHPIELGRGSCRERVCL